MTQAAIQGTFFTDDELLPYHEVYKAYGEEWVISITRGTLWDGQPTYFYNAASDRPDRWDMGGPAPVTRSVLEVAADIKARIEHGPYEMSRADYEASIKKWKQEHPAEWQAIQATYPAEAVA